MERRLYICLVWLLPRRLGEKLGHLHGLKRCSLTEGLTRMPCLRQETVHDQQNDGTAVDSWNMRPEDFQPLLLLNLVSLQNKYPRELVVVQGCK